MELKAFTLIRDCIFSLYVICTKLKGLELAYTCKHPNLALKGSQSKQNIQISKLHFSYEDHTHMYTQTHKISFTSSPYILHSIMRQKIASHEFTHIFNLCHSCSEHAYMNEIHEAHRMYKVRQHACNRFQA